MTSQGRKLARKLHCSDHWTWIRQPHSWEPGKNSFAIPDTNVLRATLMPSEVTAFNNLETCIHKIWKHKIASFHTFMVAGCCPKHQGDVQSSITIIGTVGYNVSKRFFKKHILKHCKQNADGFVLSLFNCNIWGTDCFSLLKELTQSKVTAYVKCKYSISMENKHISFSNSLTNLCSCTTVSPKKVIKLNLELR